MGNLLVGNSDCCGTPNCVDPEVQNIPGPQGPAGADCTPCEDGQNAFTSTTANFTQPAVDANVSVEVENSDWIVIGQELYIETGGYYLVISKADSTHVTVQNRGYTGNASPGATIATAAHVGPAGIIGSSGSAPAGVLLSANNLNDVADVTTSRSSLGLGTMATQAAADYLLKASNLGDVPSNATARVNLGLEINVDVIGYTGILAGLSALNPSAADQLPYSSAVNTWTMLSFPAYARSLASSATAAAARIILGNVLPRYGLLGSASAVNLNAGSTDTVISIEATRYRIDKVTVDNASLNVTTATAAVYTAAAAGGTAIANDQALSALTASTKFKDLTLQAIAGTDVFTGANLYFRVGTPQGAAATANVFIFGWVLQ